MSISVLLNISYLLLFICLLLFGYYTFTLWSLWNRQKKNFLRSLKQDINISERLAQMVEEDYQNLTLRDITQLRLSMILSAIKDIALAIELGITVGVFFIVLISLASFLLYLSTRRGF